MQRYRQPFPTSLWLVLALALLGVPNVSAQTLHAPIPITDGTANAKGGPQPNVDASRLIEHAIDRLQRQPSVAAKIRQRIDLYGRRLVGSGSYRQMNTGSDLLLRTELKVPMGDTISSLLQICDGRFLWTYQALPHEDAQKGIHTTLTRVDLDEVRRHSVGMSQRVAEGNGLQGLGYGGLPGLLNHSLAMFEFDRAEQGTLYGVPVWLLVGHYREDLPAVSQGEVSRVEANQVPDKVSQVPDKERRLEHMPDSISLALGVDDLFPYRIEFRRRQPSKSSLTSAIVVSGSETKSIMSIEFFEVQAGLKIDPQMFYFRPSDVEIQDATEAFIQNRMAGSRLAR